MCQLYVHKKEQLILLKFKQEGIRLLGTLQRPMVNTAMTFWFSYVSMNMSLFLKSETS